MKKNVVLLGMMAVGKSTIAKIAAKRGKLKFIDTDSNIQKKNLMTISEIFEKKGETFFRNEEEKEVLKSLKKSNSIISSSLELIIFFNKSLSAEDNSDLLFLENFNFFSFLVAIL